MGDDICYMPYALSAADGGSSEFDDLYTAFHEIAPIDDFDVHYSRLHAGGKVRGSIPPLAYKAQAPLLRGDGFAGFESGSFQGLIEVFDQVIDGFQADG